MTSQYRPAAPQRARRALAALPLLALLLISPARAPAAEASNLKACTNGAWSEYNSCLVDTYSEWERTECDISFSADYALCYARYFGLVRSVLVGN
jgi:hypothetical protein